MHANGNIRDEQIGITGYCMGGRLAMYAAGHYGDRVAAAAAYHPGGLATDAPDSPHKLAPRMKARIYVGAAIADPSFDAAQKERFDRALTDAHVAHTIEEYSARHGFVPSDTPTHDPSAAKRHDETLFALLRETLV
jgi:carboxymethylenebutenolidase